MQSGWNRRRAASSRIVTQLHRGLMNLPRCAGQSQWHDPRDGQSPDVSLDVRLSKAGYCPNSRGLYHQRIDLTVPGGCAGDPRRLLRVSPAGVSLETERWTCARDCGEGWRKKGFWRRFGRLGPINAERSR